MADTTKIEFARAVREIRLGTVVSNISAIRGMINKATMIMAVVKADAYGHGACEVAGAALAAGAKWLGVAVVKEGLQLRAAGIDAPILVLSPVFEEEFELLVRNKLTSTCFSLEAAIKLSSVAMRLGMSAAVHIKLDTGMNRVGYSWECPDAIVGEVRSIVALQGIVVQGVYSHLATSDADAGFAKLQYSRFCSVLEQLKHAGLHIPIKHISNSGGVLNHPEFNLDMVRCGVLTYGLAPCSTPEGAARLRALGVMPVLTLRSRIAQVKNVRFGESVGYSRNFQATRDIVVATVPIGYADGVSRRLSNKGVVLVKGRFCHIIGNVCMDQLMVDVTGVEAKLRDGVTFIGVDGEQAIYAEDVARLQGSINYEVATSVSHRISICHV